MGRPPSHGNPTFRFTSNEVIEMEAILQTYNNAMPSREVLESLAQKFSESTDRKGKINVQMKQIWNWFQNRRFAIRSKSTKVSTSTKLTLVAHDDPASVKNPPLVTPNTFSLLPAAINSGPATEKVEMDEPIMEFEAKSKRDNAWYDVGTFLSHRYLDTGDPEVLVRFSGFGPEEDEWLNIRSNIRQRSHPCEASECVAIVPGDLILCFQEGKEQALYFDAHILDAQRRRHDVRGCRCRFLVRYDHDESEEIVPLRKVCRRPETDYRLLQPEKGLEPVVAQKACSETPPDTNTDSLPAAVEARMQKPPGTGLADPDAVSSLTDQPAAAAPKNGNSCNIERTQNACDTA